MRGPVHRLLKVSVVEDNVGRFATKLKRDVLEVALGCSFHHLATDKGATCKGDLKLALGFQGIQVADRNGSCLVNPHV